MRFPIASAAFAAAFALGPIAAGLSPARSQDFSITNKVEPADASRRDLLRQLQAWWDVHAYYPRHASNSDEGGTVKVHLLIYPDGRIWSVDVVQGSGSSALDTAAVAAFKGGFVRRFAEGAPDASLELSLHYVLAHRHDEAVPAGYTPVASRRSFTITNDPVKSPILDTMLLKTCTGAVVREGIRNHPAYGGRYYAQAIFFRRPDGEPWVKFYEGGFPILSPVTEVGKIVQWTGREERLPGGKSRFTQYTVWPDGENNLSGSILVVYPGVEWAGIDQGINRGGTVDFTCASETVPAIQWSSWFVTRGSPLPPGDPP